MEQVTLRAEAGREIGSRPARRLRRDNRVPAVVYGRGLEALAVSVDRRELYGALHTGAGLNAIITLEVGSKSYTTVAREVQRHPVRNEIDHLDFIQISLDEVIQSVVGIDLVGIPQGVLDGGIVEHVQTSVTVESLPTMIPSEITLDISALHIGDSLSVSDLPEIEGVTYIDDPDTTLATVVVPRAVVEEVEEPEEGEEPELIGEGDEEAEASADEDAGEDEA